MPECSDCKQSFTDGVQCSACKKHLGFCCASITESNFRRLGADRRLNWKCLKCKANSSRSPGGAIDVASPAVPDTATDPGTAPPNVSTDAVTLETVLKEIRELKTVCSGLPTLILEVKAIKGDVEELKHSCEFAHESINDNSVKISELQTNFSEVQSLKDVVESACNEIALLKSDLAHNEQRARMNNVEIKGIPVKKNENLFSIFESICIAVGFNVQKSQINYIARVPTTDPAKKSIIVNINNRYLKEDFIAAARFRQKKHLKLADISGFGDSDSGEQLVFVNDHLTPANKELLNKTKTAAKTKNYNYIWVKHCKIHVRKNDTSKVLIVNSEKDLNKIA